MKRNVIVASRNITGGALSSFYFLCDLLTENKIEHTPIIAENLATFPIKGIRTLMQLHHFARTDMPWLAELEMGESHSIIRGEENGFVSGTINSLNMLLLREFAREINEKGKDAVVFLCHPSLAKAIGMTGKPEGSVVVLMDNDFGLYPEVLNPCVQRVVDFYNVWDEKSRRTLIEAAIPSNNIGSGFLIPPSCEVLSYTGYKYKDPDHFFLRPSTSGIYFRDLVKIMRAFYNDFKHQRATMSVAITNPILWSVLAFARYHGIPIKISGNYEKPFEGISCFHGSMESIIRHSVPAALDAGSQIGYPSEQTAYARVAGTAYLMLRHRSEMELANAFEVLKGRYGYRLGENYGTLSSPQLYNCRERAQEATARDIETYHKFTERLLGMLE